MRKEPVSDARFCGAIFSQYSRQHRIECHGGFRQRRAVFGLLRISDVDQIVWLRPLASNVGGACGSVRSGRAVGTTSSLVVAEVQDIDDGEILRGSVLNSRLSSAKR